MWDQLQVTGDVELQNAVLEKLHLDPARRLRSRLLEISQKYLQVVCDAASGRRRQPAGTNLLNGQACITPTASPVRR